MKIFKWLCYTFPECVVTTWNTYKLMQFKKMFYLTYIFWICFYYIERNVIGEDTNNCMVKLCKNNDNK